MCRLHRFYIERLLLLHGIHFTCFIYNKIFVRPELFMTLNILKVRYTKCCLLASICYNLLLLSFTSSPQLTYDVKHLVSPKYAVPKMIYCP